MRFRPALFFCFCFCLVSTPLAAGPFHAGTVPLRLSAAPGAQLFLPGEDPIARLCALLKNGGGASSDCRAKHMNWPTSSPIVEAMSSLLQLDLLSSDAADDGTFRAVLFARALTWSAPQPIETSCGRFTWSLRLDPRATQPVSEVTLRPGARDASRGTVSGTLLMTAQIRFESVETHRRLIVPSSLRLPLHGSWAAREEATRTSDPDASDLLFFTDRPACARLFPLTGKVCLSPISEGARK
jgi:hypothetical protein